MAAFNKFFDELWSAYIQLTPQALSIQSLFENDGECLVHDHVAFRTFSQSNIAIETLEPEIMALGYRLFDHYTFEEKKLDARSYVHPGCETKIFLSELRWHQLSTTAQAIISELLKQIPSEVKLGLNAGRFWALPRYADYQTLLQESEYAAWLSVWGLRVNHFTLYINALKKYQNIAQVVDRLIENGYRMNRQGGLIKGTQQDCLIQAATMADLVDVDFEDVGKQRVSTCYYEFAQRFKQKNGETYRGFVPASADKIFESTNSGSCYD